MSMPDSLCVVDHPVLQHHLGRLRDVSTSPSEFRGLVNKAATLLAAVATETLEVRDAQSTTPLAVANTKQLSQRVGLVPILRAGLGIVDPVLKLIPSAEVWHLGLFRDESTAKPVEYYRKVPKAHPVDVAYILDPMLATGGSAKLAIDVMNQWGVKDIQLVSLIAAPEGIAAVHAEFPSVRIVVGAVDERLDENKFIVPGLGDAGDRIFNTTQRN